MPDLPIIQGRPWEKNRIATLSVMLYPEDIAKRKELILDVLIDAEQKNGQLHTKDMTESLIEKLRMAPSSKDIKEHAITKFSRAYQSGLMVLYLFALRNENITVSINRAVRLVESSYSKKLAIGKPIAHSEESIRKNWRVFKGVSHLWASHLGFYEDKPVMSEADFSSFLAYAEFFRNFCEEIVPKGKNPPIINAGEMWRVPDNYELPVIKLPRVDMLDKRLKEEMNNYRVF